jgi:hypothetical protein
VALKAGGREERDPLKDVEGENAVQTDGCHQEREDPECREERRTQGPGPGLGIHDLLEGTDVDPTDDG